MKRFSFPKSKRLVTNRQFRAVLARKVCVSDQLFTLYITENDCGCARCGISVGKACGGAVVRNRLKRLLREAFRQSQEQIPADFDYLLMISPQLLEKSGKSAGAKSAARKLTFDEVRTSLLALVSAAAEKIRR